MDTLITKPLFQLDELPIAYDWCLEQLGWAELPREATCWVSPSYRLTDNYPHLYEFLLDTAQFRLGILKFASNYGDYFPCEFLSLFLQCFPALSKAVREFDNPDKWKEEQPYLLPLTPSTIFPCPVYYNDKTLLGYAKPAGMQFWTPTYQERFTVE